MENMNWSCALEKRAHDEKIDFLRKSRMCFSCLCIGHISKDCRQRLTCKVCYLKHPGILRIYQREKGKHLDQPLEEPRSRATKKLNCKLSIVPVQIKSKKGHKIIQTYAFLDQGSTASFCTVSPMKKAESLWKKNEHFIANQTCNAVMVGCGIYHIMGSPTQRKRRYVLYLTVQ